jgi:hypothetical protein
VSTAAQSRLAGLFERLKSVEVRLDRELRRRGFDPAQVDTTALPAALATLATERDEVRRELEEIQDEINAKQPGSEPTS